MASRAERRRWRTWRRAFAELALQVGEQIGIDHPVAAPSAATTTHLAAPRARIMAVIELYFAVKGSGTSDGSFERGGGAPKMGP